MQNLVLAIGAMVMMVVVTLTPFMRNSLGGPAVTVVLAILTVVGIGVPLSIAKRGLVTTAEWLAPIGLLVILVDGQQLWIGGVDSSGMRVTTYAGLVSLVAAAVAAVFAQFTGLAAPRFAAILLLQPIPALVLYPWLHDLPGWAAVLTTVAAIDLIIGWLSGQARTHGPYLRLAIRTLQEVVNAGALVCGAVALAGTHHPASSIRAGATVVAAAVVGLAAGLIFNQPPLPDVSAGVATVAFVFGFGKMAGVVLPGWGLLATSMAIAATAVGFWVLPANARNGARYAGAATAVVTAGAVIVRGWGAIAGPLRAATPAWHAKLSAYPAAVAHDAGTGTGQFVIAIALITFAAAVLVPRAWQRDSVVIGYTLAGILMPGAWHLGWTIAVVITAMLAIAAGAFGLTASTDRSSWISIASALTVGGYATGLAVARPEAQALVLFIFALCGATIGVAAIGVSETAPVPPRQLLGQPWPRALHLRVAEAGWGAAAVALPGAVAAATSALSPPNSHNSLAILAASFVAVAATLSAAAVSQVARRTPSPLLVGGAALGALAVALAALHTKGIATPDIAVALILLLSAVMLCVAPILDSGLPSRYGYPATVSPGRAGPVVRVFGLDGDEMAAAAVTGATIAALTRVTSLIQPGDTLVVLAILVLLIAAGTRSMPESWRRGPIIGGGLVGAGVAVVAGAAALDAGFAVIRINHPLWNVKLDDWPARLAQATHTPANHAQALVALLCVAAAAAIVLSRIPARMAVVIALGLAALIAPVTLGTGWWGPALFSGTMATIAGVLAAATRHQTASMTCAAVASVLFTDTIAASLVAPATTAGTLLASALVCVVVAVVATRTLRKIFGTKVPDPTHHLVMIGGGSLAAAIVVTEAAAGTLVAAAHGPKDAILIGSLGGLVVALGLLAAFSRHVEPLLAYASGAISVGGLVVALAAFPKLTTAGAYGAVAAMLAILVEMLRAAVDERRAGGGGWLPRRTAVLLGAGPAATLALISLAPTILAALVGPYHEVPMVWQHTPVLSRQALGDSAKLVGDPFGAVTALLLTLTAMLGAIGFGGSREVITGRAVAVGVPGLAITLLIAPYLLDTAWPTGQLAALAVATISGLAIAWTNDPPDTDAAPALRAARQFVTIICVLSAGAGLAGGLATPATTIASLAVASVAGLGAALWGRRQSSRIAGWIVTATGAQLLTLVSCLRLGVATYNSAFVVGGVAAALLIMSMTLPRLRREETGNETLTVQATAYGGSVLGLALAAQSLPHLSFYLFGWGAVLGMAASRQRRNLLYRSVLMWFASAHVLAGWVLLMAFSSVALPEAYTLGIAAIALVTGWIELRWHPELTSWVSYGVALAVALGPSLAIVIATGETPLRRTLLLIAAAATTVGGSLRRQQAPVIIGGVVLLGAVGNEIARYSTTILILVLMAIIASVLVGVGANYEKRRRNLQRVRGAFNRMQ